MKSNRKQWLLFFLCIGAVTAVLSWITWSSLDVEAREHAMQQKLQEQESLRLALWRMDSAFTPILAQEAARPSSFYSSSKTYASKLATNPPADFFRLYFQISPGGEIQSQQHEKLAELRPLVDGAGLRSLFGCQTVNLPDLAASPSSELAQQQSLESWEARQQSDYQARASNVQQSQTYQTMMNSITEEDNPFLPPSTPSNMKPTWVQNPSTKQWELFFSRERTESGLVWVQGIWANWPWIEQWLLKSIVDIFPNARLRPMPENTPALQNQMLASIPAVLETGCATPSGTGAWTALRWTLFMTWIVVGLAITTAGFMLRTAMDLSERRGRFVSAVTHELRTPLTTFTLYSQMLADGMVTEESSKKEYLETLKKESERLARIVENVLLYARVEGKRAAVRNETMLVKDLLDRVLPRLEQRAAESHFQIQTQHLVESKLSIQTDPAILEQILLNLVDNSCKYAASASDKRLHLETSIQNGQLRILYSDHGPGIPAGEEKRVFEPFQRSSRESTGTVPGIGLGLSLSKAMAQELGGSLDLVQNDKPRIQFQITLPC